MSAVTEVLKEAAKYKKIYFKANSGNAGDSLINFGFYSLADELGLLYEEVDEQYDYANIAGDSVLILSGGGNIVPYWEACSNILREVTRHEFPVIMLSQSIQGRRDVLRLLRQCDILILREKFSYDYALSLDLNCRLYIDHDLAFYADLEYLYGFKKVLPPVFNLSKSQKLLKIYYHKTRALFCRELKAFRTDHEANLKIKAKKINDIARAAKFGTRGILENAYSAISLLEIVKRYKFVETDRLHVFIACLLAGTKVLLHDNVYYKIRGVYEHSVKDNPRYSHLVNYQPVDKLIWS